MTTKDSDEQNRSMRVLWFDHVRKTRGQMSRKLKRPVTHQEAMREASISWPSKKLKIQKKRKRAKNKIKRELNT